MTKQPATEKLYPVSHTEIPDEALAWRIERTRSSLQHLSGERHQAVLRGLTYLLFEQEARESNGQGPFAQTGLAVQGYITLYGTEGQAPGGFIPPVLEASGGPVTSS